MVKVGFKDYDKRVLPEMSAKVLFLNKNAKAADLQNEQYQVVPQSAVFERNGNKVVFIVKDDHVVQIPVTIGNILGSYVEIKSGVTLGENVIEIAGEEIKEGLKVNVK